MWGQPLESRCSNHRSEVISSSGFGGRHLESIVNNVGRHQRRHDRVGRGRKCGGSRWNNVCMLLETEVTSTSRKSMVFP